MRIGINIVLQHSFFSNGHASCSWSLAETLTKFGHSVTLVNIGEPNEWFVDVPVLKDVFPRIHIEKVTQPFDLFIDIDGTTHAEKRAKLGQKYIVFLRHPVVIHEIEACVYPMNFPKPNYLVCDAIWLWEHFGEQDAHIMKLLSQKPVYRIPYIWSSTPVDQHRKDINSKGWLEVTESFCNEAKKESLEVPWICHNTEMNLTNCNNCTLPLVALGYAKKHNAIPLQTFLIHNAQHLEKLEYFMKNVLEHTHVDGFVREFVGRQRCTDWTLQPKSFVFSHARFLNLKPYLVDCLWNGIPVVHNSPWLRDLGLGYYYPDNGILKSVDMMKQMVADFDARVGHFSANSLEKVRAQLMRALEPSRDVWDAALSFEKAVPVSAASAAPLKTTLRVGFSDMWQSANCSYNFWTLLLTEALQKSSIKKVEGVQITEANAQTEAIDLLFFAPFGETWRQVPSSVPKVHITGENTLSKGLENGVFLNLGFEHTNLGKGILRFPLWLQYLDWFGADQDRLENPRTMPLETLFAPCLKEKTKFCAFVVSNPSNAHRNAAFHALSTYKQVDSAGRLFNNIGSDIFVNNGGGGGGELKKLEFLKDYKFCFAFENSSSRGYVTEKILAAKAAGCVPIYWGAPDVVEDFSKGSFLNVTDMSIEQMVEAVKNLDNDPVAWRKCVETPGIVGGIEKCRAWLAMTAKTVLSRILDVSIPSVLGNVPTLTHTSKPEFTITPQTLFVTFTTQSFLPSLQTWASSVVPRLKDESMKALVYLGHDINENTEKTLRSHFPSLVFRRLTTQKVDGFPDIWNPQHFAWKIWIYYTLSHEPLLKGSLVWYTDVGSIHVRFPEEYIQIVREKGIVVLEDSEQKNDQWCHARFCELLAVTEEEKQQKQIVAGILAFVSGSCTAMFEEAWKWSQNPEVIVGPKWAGTLADGRPYGHRHDQSILSILRIRYKVSSYPLEKLYCDESIRRTYKSGLSLYVHRGHPVENQNFAPGIGDVHLVNLERRKDRIQKFKENHGPWTKKVSLRPAYDGKALKLTPALARLFMPNDFLWKKAIAGCALSHLSLWNELVKEPNSCDTYLVLEDDVKFQPQWLEVWQEASKCIPEDFDVLYLGGVLPPNRQGYESLLESVNPFWNRIRHNQMFGQNPPTRYFHFCTYAYVITRRGAKKLLDTIMAEDGYRTSADHMMCNRVDLLNYYSIQPLIAGCCQDDDPVYQQSAFNNFNRVDSFDSDIWNNDERFSLEEIQKCLSKPVKLNLQQALDDGRFLTKPLGKTFLTIKPLGSNIVNLESKWLKEIFGTSVDTVTTVGTDHTALDTHPIFILQRPHIETSMVVLSMYEKEKKPFSILHVSDEYLSDPVDCYAFSMCKKVYRNYPRSFPSEIAAKVVTLPLGYTKNIQIPTFAEDEQRPLAWSFHATRWHGREKVVEALTDLKPNSYVLYNDWMDPAQLKGEEYSAMLLSSTFVPCPRGQNLETFRFYEALELGCIPVYVREGENDPFYKFVAEKLPILNLSSWEQAVNYMNALLQNKETLVQYRKTLLQKWCDWKQELQKA